MNKLVNFWNLISFDYAGDFSKPAGNFSQTGGHSSKFTGHQANLYPSATTDSTPLNTDQVVHYLTKTAGVDSKKLILGIPLYGRGFADTDGLGKPFNGGGDGSLYSGIWDYKALPPAESNPIFFDDTAKASYSHDPNRRLFISLQDRKATEAMGLYAQDKMLGGAWWYDINADKSADDSLVNQFAQTVGGTLALDESRGQIDFPQSNYTNIRGIMG